MSNLLIADVDDQPKGRAAKLKKVFENILQQAQILAVKDSELETAVDTMND